MTIKDIARHCGVSVSTVSRVLNNKPDVSEAVREKVLQAVEELHYVPNSTARDLVMPAPDAVGLVAKGDGNQFYTGIISHIEHSLRSAGYGLVMEPIRHGEDELWAGAALARSKRLRGLIFLGGRFDYSAENAARVGVPFVCCTYTNAFGSLSPESYSSVTIDDVKAGHDAVEMLTRRGHRRIAVVLSTVDDRSISELRCVGYRRALEENGIAFDPALVLEVEDFSMASAKAAAERAVASGLDFSAVFAVSDSLAIAVMKGLHECGLRVPEDVSVVGIDGMEMSAYTIPSLCTYSQPVRELGERSAEIIVDMIEGRGEARHLLLEPAFIEGGSVRRL